MRVSRKDKFVMKVWLLQKCSKLPKTGCCYFPLVLKNIRNVYPCMRYFVWETWWPTQNRTEPQDSGSSGRYMPQKPG